MFVFFVFSLITYYYLKDHLVEESGENNPGIHLDKKKNPVKSNLTPMEELENLTHQITQKELRNKLESIMHLLYEVLEKKELASMETNYEIKRLALTDLKDLLSLYVSLSGKKKNEMKEEFESNLETIHEFLKDVQQGIHEKKVHEFQVKMNVIKKRYDN